MPMGDYLQNLQFTIPEILSLIGLVQCVYILVYIAFRAGGFVRVLLPFAYFLTLGAAFFTGFSERLVGELFTHYDLVSWALWFAGPPLSVLLMIQIAKITEAPPLRSFALLALVPLAFGGGLILSRIFEDGMLKDWLVLTGLLAGIISLMAMWWQRPLLLRLSLEPAGRARYWLIIALVLLNLFFLGTMLLGLTNALSMENTRIIRTIWGLGFVYLAGTSLFRIYPQAVRLIDRAAPRAEFNDDDRKIAERIENLLNLEKVYQEPSYNRVTLAKELEVSETVISRIVNQHFGKTLPQLFSERRVADAKRLLLETDGAIKTIAEDVGFNSIATFNRVFKELENISPGQYRALHTKNKEVL
jgi:AraC-like DNA-binding protein